MRLVISEYEYFDTSTATIFGIVSLDYLGYNSKKKKDVL